MTSCEGRAAFPRKGKYSAPSIERIHPRTGAKTTMAIRRPLRRYCHRRGSFDTIPRGHDACTAVAVRPPHPPPTTTVTSSSSYRGGRTPRRGGKRRRPYRSTRAARHRPPPPHFICPQQGWAESDLSPPLYTVHTIGWTEGRGRTVITPLSLLPPPPPPPPLRPPSLVALASPLPPPARPARHQECLWGVQGTAARSGQ